MLRGNDVHKGLKKPKKAVNCKAYCVHEEKAYEIFDGGFYRGASPSRSLRSPW